MVIHSLRKKCLLLLNSNRILAIQCRHQETLQRFCETRLKNRFVGHMFLKCNVMSWRTAFYRQNLLNFLQYTNVFLNSWQIQVYQLQTASIGRISWAKTLNIINLRFMFGLVVQHVNGPGLLSFLLVVVILFSFFFLNIFYLLADFNLFILLSLITASRGVAINVFL